MNEEQFPFHLQYKHPGTFANRKYEDLSYPKNPKMCDPILVTLLKMQRHYSQSSRENAIPSSGISPLASYKEVPPPPSSPRVEPGPTVQYKHYTTTPTPKISKVKLHIVEECFSQLLTQ